MNKELRVEITLWFLPPTGSTAALPAPAAGGVWLFRAASRELYHVEKDPAWWVKNKRKWPEVRGAEQPLRRKGTCGGGGGVAGEQKQFLSFRRSGLGDSRHSLAPLCHLLEPWSGLPLGTGGLRKDSLSSRLQPD